jgi:hypothetical protein
MVARTVILPKADQAFDNRRHVEDAKSLSDRYARLGSS